MHGFSKKPTPVAGVMDAPLYVAGEHKLEGFDEPIILSANENPLGPSEQALAGRVLNAAFLTYVASAFTALMTLLYYLLRFGLLGGSDD